MRCAACAATADGWDRSPLCPACHAIAGGPLPAAELSAGSPLWLWTSRDAAAALATGSLSVILKAYRASTGTSQATLAATLGYDTSYISMIENGRRVISDVTTLRRLVSHLGLPPHVLGLTDPQDADFISMIQFGESTIRLASVARQAGQLPMGRADAAPSSMVSAIRLYASAHAWRVGSSKPSPRTAASASSRALPTVW
jgi:transcriptional regulator with XRE-family HTH domain